MWSKTNPQSDLFGNDGSDEEVTLGTNKSYAKHYDEFRKKEILSHREYSDDLFTKQAFQHRVY